MTTGTFLLLFFVGGLVSAFVKGILADRKAARLREYYREQRIPYYPYQNPPRRANIKDWEDPPKWN